MNDRTLSDLSESVASLAGKDPAGYADLYLASGVAHSAIFEDGRIEQLTSGKGSGFGARIIRGENTFFSRGTGVDTDAVHRGLLNVASMSNVSFSSAKLNAASQPILAVPGGVSPLDIDFMRELDSNLRKNSANLRQITFSYKTSAKDVLIVQGNGRIVADRREYSSFSVNIVVERHDVLQTGYESLATVGDVSALWQKGAAEKIAFAAYERAMLMLDAVPCPAGKMEVVLDGHAGGTMIHEACGHGLEADIIIKDFSSYANKLGTLVASPLITLVDDATLRNCYGSYQFDDEGTPSQRTVLIENGILKNYLTDILSSRMGGFPLTGNGRRESSQSIPIPRMSNTFVLQGDASTEDIVTSVSNGLYVKKMGGGEVDTTSGDYVFYVSEGYLIENGKIGKAVRGATLTGNGPETLMNIEAVGKSFSLESGVCGKNGQGVPVTDGQPTLLLKDIVVGGSNTDYGGTNA